MNYSEQILKARFEQLPESVREAIIATPWKEKLRRISEKHKLHIDQADRLGKETVIVMFGLEHPDNLIYNIAKNVEISEEKAEAIAEDLNREIFLKVRESLTEIFKERGEGEKEKGESGLLGKREETESKTKTEEKKEEEMPSREDILKEIEDKEHHNLPIATVKQEIHMEIKPPSEIKVFEKPADLPSQKTANVAKTEKSVEINSFMNKGESEQERKIFEKVNRNPSLETKFPSEAEAIKTMPNDIFKLKMSGMVNAPKETIEIVERKTLPKKTSLDIGKKIDPYREVLN